MFKKNGAFRINRIYENIGISRQALNDIRKDFLKVKSVKEFLKRKKRETPLVPPKITGKVEAQIIATACSKVPEGYARWMVRLLADKVVELGLKNGV